MKAFVMQQVDLPPGDWAVQREEDHAGRTFVVLGKPGSWQGYLVEKTKWDEYVKQRESDDARRTA